MSNAIIPIPRCSVSVRPATLADLPFMDRLQKKHGKALGYFPTKQFEEYVQTGGVLIAEATNKDEGGRMKDEKGGDASSLHPSSFIPHPSRLGYIISRDRYLKRDELGVIYQLCVEAGAQRKLVGAMLVREAFERSAYGCRLYCCWCAQDLDANYFWESLGFVPVAFRAGSTGKKRVHIFWQRRIGADDVTTRYWYPFQTCAGAIREDRLVFPIPPGVHWSDVQAVNLPREGSAKLEGRNPKPISNPKSKIQKKKQPGAGQVAIIVGGRIKYIDRPGHQPQKAAEFRAPLPAPKRARPKRSAAKIDPKYLAAARELRDRYLEQFNAGLVLPQGKYEVSRMIADGSAAGPGDPAMNMSVPLLPAPLAA